MARFDGLNGIAGVRSGSGPRHLTERFLATYFVLQQDLARGSPELRFLAVEFRPEKRFHSQLTTYVAT